MEETTTHVDLLRFCTQGTSHAPCRHLSLHACNPNTKSVLSNVVVNPTPPCTRRHNHPMAIVCLVQQQIPTCQQAHTDALQHKLHMHRQSPMLPPSSPCNP